MSRFRSFVASLIVLMALLAAGALTGPTGAAAATTYHVSTTGQDGEPGRCDGGSADAPWRSIEYGMRCVQPGDTLIVNGGTYRERVAPYQPDGIGATETDPITVRARTGQNVLIRGAVRLDRPDHWTIDGLHVTNDGGTYDDGQYLVKIRGGTGWTWSDSEIWGATSYAAVRVEPTSGIDPAPSNWRFVGNCVHDTAAVHDAGQDHNLYIHTGPGGSGTIERNIIFGAPNGQNIKLGTGIGKGDHRTEHVRVRHNTLFGARQNVVVVGDSNNNAIERNLMGHVIGEPWYPNVRGYSLTGAGNSASHNAAYTGNEGSFVFVGNESASHEDSTRSFSTSDNRFPVTPQFDSTSACDGLYPTKSSYRAYGAYAPVPTADPIQRIAGSGRIETSVAISRTSFPTAGSAGSVVLARADTYPDALAGGPLAAALDAPILLSARDALPPQVAEEIERLGADRAVLLGGTAALSDRVRRDLERMGMTVERVDGADRFTTAANVAARLKELTGSDMRDVYVVEGADADPNRGWPDAVAVGSLAAGQGRAILLVTTESLPDATRRAFDDLGVTKASVIGGPASVSDSVVKAIGASGLDVRRIAGPSRFATSRIIADIAHQAGADPARTWFATGSSFPDALTAGPAVARDGGILLLVPGSGTQLNADAAAWLDRFGGQMERLRLIGGPAAISYALEDKSRYELAPW